MLLVFTLCCNTHLTAQSNFRYEAELLTPSTDSWNMIKHGSVGASLYTGTVNLSIPFYTYQDKDFTIPISFDYASNGHMPNQKGGVLGPDWNLNVGGTITAEIKGTPDYGVDSYGNPGFFELSKNTNVLGKDISKIARFVNLDYRITTGMHSPIMLFSPDGHPHTPGTKYDCEPDLYNFSFLGHSGSFHRGYGDTTYIYNTNTNNQDYKVVFSPYFDLITIITSDGYKYEFSTMIGNSDLVEEADRHLRVAWKLTRIVAPNGREVLFNYSFYFSSDCQPSSIDVTGTLIQFNIDNNPIDDVGMHWEHNITDVNKSNMILTSIEISNGPIINFSYNQLPINQSDEFAPLPVHMPTTSISDRLKKISITSSSGALLKETTLTYKNNNAGKRINYLASVLISGEGLFQMDYHNWNNHSYPFPGNGTFSVDHWGYYNGKNNGNLHSIPFLKLGYISNGSLIITSNARDANGAYAKTGMLQKITYPTGGYTLLEYEPHDYSLAFNRQSGIVSKTGVCGGVRIKSISNFTSPSQPADKRTFEYKTGQGESSGILLHFPVYYAEYSAYTTGGISENNIRYYSSGINSYGSTHIEYSRVSEKHNDSSKVVYEFSNSALSYRYADAVLVSEVVEEPFYTYGKWVINNNSLAELTAPITSKQAERGKLLSKQIFNASTPSIPEYLETNSYNINDYLSLDYLPAYLIRKIGYYVKYTDNYKQKRRTISENRAGVVVSTAEEYNYNQYGQLIKLAICDSKGDSIITRYQYVKDLNPSLITPSSVYDNMIKNNVIGMPLSEMVYIKKGGVGSELLISGKRYSYINPRPAKRELIRLSKIELYDIVNQTWFTDIEFTSFDNQGNILESRDRNGISTCYVWGYKGLYLVAKVENIELAKLKTAVPSLAGISSNPLEGEVVSTIQYELKSSQPMSMATLFKYIPFVGLSKVTDPSGNDISYEYNSSGKLNFIRNALSQPLNRFLYSTDNKL